MTPTFEAFSFDHQKLQEVIVPIISIQNDQPKYCGTGFIIGADGLLITAKHVTEFAIDGTRIQRVDSQTYEVPIGLFALKLMGNDKGGLWPIEKVWSAKELDIAIGWLRGAEIDGKRYYHKTVGLNLFQPQVGHSIHACGYYKAMASTTIPVQGIDGIDINQHTAISSGKIIEIYPSGRDRIMIPWPCFRTDARLDSGMSGGPVFNSLTGKVCGVVCSSLSEGPDSENFVSFVSAIWPLLAIPVEIVIPDISPMPKIYPIYELVKRKFIDSDINLEKVDCVQTGERQYKIEIQK